MADFAAIDGVEWTAMHAFFANMGGFAISFAAASDGLSDTDSPGEDKTTTLAATNKGARATHSSYPILIPTEMMFKASST